MDLCMQGESTTCEIKQYSCDSSHQDDFKNQPEKVLAFVLETIYFGPKTEIVFDAKQTQII